MKTPTKVKVGYTGANMAMDKAYPVKLAFAPGTLISTYGYESLEMDVTYPAPWKTIGKGTYHDLYVLPVYADVDPEKPFQWECELQQHEIDPTRYRWLHPYGEVFAKFCASSGLGELAPRSMIPRTSTILSSSAKKVKYSYPIRLQEPE